MHKSNQPTQKKGSKYTTLLTANLNLIAWITESLSSIHLIPVGIDVRLWPGPWRREKSHELRLISLHPAKN